MLVIYDNELIHTDSSSDIIEHFGVRGMKWGTRRSQYNGLPKIGQFSGRINRNLVTRKTMKRNNEKKIAALGKNDPRRRELINKNKDLTNMNQKAALRLVRNKRIKKVVGTTAGVAAGAATQYMLWKATDPRKAAAAEMGAKVLGKTAKAGAKAAAYGAKKVYNQAKYNMGGVVKRKYM